MTLQVHRLVAKAFIHNPLNKPEVNHCDGNKTNNRVENLEWVTRSENEKHAVESGLLIPQLGSKHGQSRLKEEDIQLIFQMRKDGMTFKEIGKHFNVDPTTPHKIVKGTGWRHVAREVFK